MKDKIITAILVLIVGLFLLPLAKFNDQQETNELKGFSARDIQFIESIGFVDNLDGSWSINTSSSKSSTRMYTFDYLPILSISNMTGVIKHIQLLSTNNIRFISYDFFWDANPTTQTITLWGGDVS